MWLCTFYGTVVCKSHPISLFMIMTLVDGGVVKVENKMENNRNYEQCARKKKETRKTGKATRKSSPFTMLNIYHLACSRKNELFIRRS